MLGKYGVYYLSQISMMHDSGGMIDSHTLVLSSLENVMEFQESLKTQCFSMVFRVDVITFDLHNFLHHFP